LNEMVAKVGAAGVDVREDVAKISVVGIGMQAHGGVASKMFQALGDAKVNIILIGTSEIKISCLINLADADRALRVVHDKFDLGTENAG